MTLKNCNKHYLFQSRKTKQAGRSANTSDLYSGVRYSNLRLDTDYADWILSWYSWKPSRNYWDRIVNYTTTTSFRVIYD